MKAIRLPQAETLGQSFALAGIQEYELNQDEWDFDLIKDIEGLYSANDITIGGNDLLLVATQDFYPYPFSEGSHRELTYWLIRSDELGDPRKAELVNHF